jgi:hypothetical protein
LRPEVFKATMRTLGKRAGYTEGWPEELETFDRTWLPDEGQNRYRLHPAFRVVLDSGRVKL